MVHSPHPFATAVPVDVDPAKSSTVLPASAVPVKVGVVSAVMLSVLEVPESLEAARSGADGAAGTAVSIVTASAVEWSLVPPAVVAVAVNKYVLGESALLVMVQSPLTFATAVPTVIDPANRVTVLATSAV